MKRLLLMLRRRWPQVTLLLALLLLVSCVPESCAESEIVKDIRRYTGVDITNYREVAQTALTGETTGNKNQDDALSAVEAGFRREKYTAEGDEAFKEGRFDNAYGNYSKALLWNKPDNTARQIKAEKLREEMALARAGLGSESFRNGDYRHAAGEFESSANLAEVSRDSAVSRLDTKAADYYAYLANSYRLKSDTARKLANAEK